MAKKIIVLNGSPRTNGNTASLIGAFTEGAESAGHRVTVFNLMGMDIRPCTGCMKGGKNPESPCVQKDAMDGIYMAFTEADIVVLASPLYYWSVTGLLKVAFDRLYAATEANAHITPPKECILLMAAGNSSPEVYEPCIGFHAALMRHMGWSDIGRVLATGTMMPGNIKRTPWLEEARQLGASL